MNVLLTIATIIIVALSIIAIYYLFKVHQLKKEQAEQTQTDGSE